jgi:cation:H+ antiporter
MLLNVVLLIVGLVVLYFGAEWLVAGASKIALAFGISPMIIGLTIVAFATSAPEFVVTLLATLDGSPDIGVGNVVGSNVANIALIIGASCLVFPMAVEPTVLRRDYPIMMVAMAIAGLFAFQGLEISRLEGLALLGILAAFLGICLRTAVKQSREYRATGQFAVGGPPPKQIAFQALKALIGIVMLVIGAKLMVDNAVTIAREFGISELVIGVTIVAFGTSLPELATSLVAAFKKEPDISLGNIIGSNIFNTCFILGGVSVLHPLPVSEQAATFDLPASLVIGLLLFPLMRFDKRIGRIDAMLLTGSYITYIVLTYRLSTGAGLH